MLHIWRLFFLLIVATSILSALWWWERHHSFPELSYVPPEDFQVPQCNPNDNECMRAAVVQAIRHAFFGHYKYATLQDHLRPLEQIGHNWLYAQATMVDSIDTLYLAGLDEEYQACRHFFAKHGPPMPFIKQTNTFEYGIRVIGGFLGAFSVTHDESWLHMARQSAESLMAFAFNTDSGLPRKFSRLTNPDHFLAASIVRLINYIHWKIDPGMTQNTIVAMGTFSAEFRYLSCVTGDEKFAQAAQHITQTASKNAWHSETGNFIGVNQIWDVDRGIPKSPHKASLVRGDSFYEYTIKDFLIDPQANLSLKIYHDYVNRLKDSGFRYGLQVDGVLDEEIAFPLVGYEHLVCFAPGWLLLEEYVSASEKARAAWNNTENPTNLRLAQQVMKACMKLYEINKFFLGAESAELARVKKPNGDDKILIKESFYELRPEVLESNFYLLRKTGDAQYREFAWKVFQALETHSRVPGGGYVGLDTISGRVWDHQPSYFIAETLKYLLLTFTPADQEHESPATSKQEQQQKRAQNPIDLGKYVFTTEAHPLDLRFGCRSQQEDEQNARLERLKMASTWAPVWEIQFILNGSVLLLVALRLCFSGREEKIKQK